MNLAIITNLYPRPDQPQRGLYNAQLFEAMGKELSVIGCPLPDGASQASSIRNSASSFLPHPSSLLVVCLVPECRLWRWRAIRAWNVGEENGERGTGNAEGVGAPHPFFARLRRASRGAKIVGRGRLDAERGEARGAPTLPLSHSSQSSYVPRSTFHVLQSLPTPHVLYHPVFYVPLIGRSLSWWTYARALRRVEDVISRCDCVLATWLYPDAAAVAELARRLNKPFWIKVHGSDTFHLRNAVRRKHILRACSYARGIISNCQHLADKLSEAGVERSKLHVVPNGVDAAVFRFRTREQAAKELSVVGDQRSEIRDQRSDARSQHVLPTLGEVEAPVAEPGVDEDGPVDVERGAGNTERRIVLFVGNLLAVKGPDILLEAWTRVVERGMWNAERAEGGNSHKEHEKAPETDGTNAGAPRPGRGAPALPTSQGPKSTTHVLRSTSHFPQSDPILLVIGDGPMRKSLEKQAERLGIAGSVVFLGSRRHAEIALWMNVAHCLCLPSRSEGMPNVVLEALASGLPVVATDVGDVAGLVKNGVNGFLIGPGQADVVASLALGLDKAVGREWDRRQIARSVPVAGWDKAACEIIGLMGR